jgi:phosphodiesterase/alkaline phosphatase D-like protein
MAYEAGRTMLAAAQINELAEDLLDAQRKGITWKFVLVPEPIQNLGGGAAGDRFEGYAFERTAILNFIRDRCIGNVAFISGDIHGTIANNLVYRPDPDIPLSRLGYQHRPGCLP